jgi:hypothetical protein
VGALMKNQAQIKDRISEQSDRLTSSIKTNSNIRLGLLKSLKTATKKRRELRKASANEGAAS